MIPLWQIVLGTAAVALWAYTLFDCWRNESERITWLTLLVIFHVGMAPVYFVLRSWPRLQARRRHGSGLSGSSAGGGRVNRQELEQAEQAAENIGNAHQWFRLGELYRDAGRTREAAEAFSRAIAKDAEHAGSRYEAGRLALNQKDYQRARDVLEPLIERDPRYKFGEAYLIYAQALLGVQDYAAANKHLREHLARFGRPEARLMLAETLMHEGNDSEARAQLYLLIGELRQTNEFQMPRQRALLKETQQLLKRLPTPEDGEQPSSKPDAAAEQKDETGQSEQASHDETSAEEPSPREDRA